MTKKKCVFCGHAVLLDAQVEYIYRRDGNLLVVQNVPCERCEYCGEEYFKAPVLKKIEGLWLSIRDKRRKPARAMRVPVEQYA